jgi:hypothetical protein
MERDRSGNKPYIHITHVAPSDMPARVEDEQHQVWVHKNESGVLFVRVAKQEQLVFSASVSALNEVDLLFPDGRRVLFPAMRHEEAGEPLPPQAQESMKPPEHPAITLEGNPAFKHKYDPKKRTYLLRLAYHPNPRNTKEALFYNVVAQGEKAEAFYGLYITDTRMQVRVTGDDISETVRKREGTAGTIKAESIEIIRGRKAGSEILHEKVQLSDLP